MSGFVFAVRARYARTPAVLRGIAFMVMATLFFAYMQVAIRVLSQDLHPFVVVFFRNVFGVLVFAPWFARQGLAPLRARRFGLLFLRATLGSIAQLFYFTALKLTPLAKVAALNFCGPLFATLLAFLVLRERIRTRRIIALVVGFSGTLVILRPGMVDLDVGALLVVCSVGFWGISIIVVKVLTRSESSVTITLYTHLFAIPLTLLPALLVWQVPNGEQYVWLAAIGVLGSLAHLCFAQACRETEVTAVVPFDFMRLIWAAILGYVLFAEVPHATTWIGAVMIFSAVLYITYREAKAGDEETGGRS